jgi:uncharacterized protein YmfQ (DUF2313 family)
MGRTYKEYRKLLQSLLPRGRAWTRDENSTLTELLNGFGEELARIETRSEDLIDETFPRSSVELLTDHETDYAIPDEGNTLAPTTGQRQNVIYAKKVGVGQQDPDYFITIGAALGYTLTITEYVPSLAGIVKAGEEIGGEYVGYYWTVNIDVSAEMMEFYTLANITQLIIEIEKRKPAHTEVFFRYTGVGFSSGFSQGFDAQPWYDGSSWPIGFGRGFSNGFANSSDYDGVLLTGGYSSGFSQGFDSDRGGGFGFDSFSSGFNKPT